MNRKALAIIIGSVLTVTLFSGIVFALASQKDSEEASAETSASDYTDNSESDYTYIPPDPEEEVSDDTEEAADDQETADEIADFVPADEMDLEPSSITVYVNKEYALPKDYKPEHLVTPNVRFDITYYDERTLMRPEAAKALEKLFTAAGKDGYELVGVSGYRSYNRQYTIFTNNIVTKGKKHTLMYSAVPGTSEHQTGLAIDVSSKALHNKLSEDFASTPEGKWLAENSYRYGYIIRYPKDKAEITGYAYEPWHIRYVGKALANYLYTNKLTLDEYYKYTPSPDFDFEAQYAAIINYVPPTKAPTMTPTITPTPPVPTEGADGSGEEGESPTGTPDNEAPDDGISIILTPTPSMIPVPSVTEFPSEDGMPDEENDLPDGSIATTDIIIE